ncbi:hypothetical protein UFOVP244_9 [uncultured Caudovirales phage]|uniref:Uncharacterized protein n=1 Tax=uncultured Caudovirales phage TaxID=2100421 RepID=A0A6J7WRN0_9CAUD|nr:hypothetical protein UFOVP244_9 [uncultured Caudovirales phage]
MSDDEKKKDQQDDNVVDFFTASLNKMIKNASKQMKNTPAAADSKARMTRQEKIDYALRSHGSMGGASDLRKAKKPKSKSSDDKED